MQWKASAAAKSKTIEVGQDKKKKKVQISYFPETKTVVEEINGTRNVRYFERSTAVVDGRWFCVGFYGLATVAWNGKAWDVLVDEKQGEKLFGKTDARIDAIATDGKRAWAVATTGAVFEWNGETWKALAKTGGALFEKQRRFARLAWDGTRERLVMWGGDNGGRSSNDTLLFEKNAWRKSAKPGTKLAARKADNYWMYDAGTQVVRVGPEGCYGLDGDAWKAHDHEPPRFLTADSEAPTEQMIVAHGAKTRWIDPIAGAIYLAGAAKPEKSVGTPPGMVSRAALEEAGAYFWNDFELANDRDWMWAWDPAKRRAFGMRLGSSKFVCELDLSSLP